MPRASAGTSSLSQSMLAWGIFKSPSKATRVPPPSHLRTGVPPANPGPQPACVVGLGHGGFRFLQIVGQPFQALNLRVQFMLLGQEVFRGDDVVFFRGAPKRVVALLEHAKLRGVRLLLPSQVVERVGQVCNSMRALSARSKAPSISASTPATRARPSMRGPAGRGRWRRRAPGRGRRLPAQRSVLTHGLSF